MRKGRYLALLVAIVAACRAPRPPALEAAAPAQAAVPAAAPVPSRRVALIGDYGAAGPDAAQVAALVASLHPEAIVTLGDNNYEDGLAATLDDNVVAYYHAFLDLPAAYGGRFRGQGSANGSHFFPSLGNHDWRAPGAQPYLDLFQPPGNGRYYQVDFGELAVFVLDSDPHEPDGIDANSQQARWLQAALARSSAQIRAIVLHHPPYSSGPHGDHPVVQWPFAQWGASVVVAGHDHHYERMRVGGLPFVVAGTGGHALRPAVLRLRPEASEQHLISGRHGALLLTTGGATGCLRFFAANGELLDAVALKGGGRPAGEL